MKIEETYEDRYEDFRDEMLALGVVDDYDLHAAAEAYGLDRRRSVESVARAYGLARATYGPFIAAGGVRGECGHMHRTIAAAADCADRDQAAMRRLPGGCYSDRGVHIVGCRVSLDGCSCDRELPTDNALAEAGVGRRWAEVVAAELGID